MLTALEIYSILLENYGQPMWWSDDPYTVIVQAVLVQNTGWSNVEKTTLRLGDRLNPQYINAVSAEELEALIHPCGFQKAKARTIKALTEWFVSLKAKNRAEMRNELLSIKGIGEESADVILVYAFHQPSFPIDAYTRRFLERLGYRFTKDSERRLFFEKNLPQDATVYGYFHWLLLEHGKTHCSKTAKCTLCPFSSCASRQKDNQSAFTFSQTLSST